MSIIHDALTRKKQQNPQYDYLWRVELPVLGSPTGSMIATGLDSYSRSRGIALQGTLQNISNILEDLYGPRVHEDSFELNHRVYRFTSSFRSFDVERVTKGPSFTHAASNSSMGTISMAVDELEDGKTLQYFDLWHSLIRQGDGWSYNVPAFYKRDIRYIKMSASKLDLHYSIYKGFFPTEIAPSETSYDGNNILQYNITLAGDDVEHIFIPEGQLVSMLNAEEEAILRNNFSKSGFRIGNIDSLRTSKIIENVIGMFLR